MAKSTENKHGLGRRKRAIARVIVRKGKGNITVNGRELLEYFNNRELWVNKILEPINLVEEKDSLDILIRVNGGGLKGQAEAVVLGVARAMLEYNDSYRSVFKPLGFLTRDAREVERKHYYSRKARKAPQFSKR